MSLEIERKFRVLHEPDTWPLERIGASAVEIRQGYLTAPGMQPEVRIRKAREVTLGSAGRTVPQSLTGPGGVHVVRKLTIKGASADGYSELRRLEIEIELSAAQFDEAWRLTKGRQLRKVRISYSFRIAVTEVLAVTVDAFRGRLRGLMLAEVEFDDEAACEAFVPPPYLGDEVTHDPRYRNAELAVADGPPE